MIARRIPPREEQPDVGCWWLPWGISYELAYRLMLMADQAAPLELDIISGFRTAEEQRDLDQEGRPAAPEALSTHRTCPATGADLSLPTVTTTDQVKAMFGGWTVFAGLRWGGGSPVSSAGIPLDWNHVDLGPRMDPVAQEYRSHL